MEQAKAAILYPPDGLHTLIVGQTGVGKTLFAHMMYEYGVVMKKLAAEAPFVTFNCADYYNNPQLLISHIFGHIKGAFTGATTEDPNSVLTKTFVRRIPNIITILPLSERSLEEKFAIIKMLLADEVCGSINR